MKVIVAKNSGFCGGVRRSVDLAEESLEKTGDHYCLGQIVHNPQQVKMLEDKGMKTIEKKDLDNIHDSTVVVRAHGIDQATKEKIVNNNNRLVDATCPVLTNIYKKIAEKEEEGYKIIIVGDRQHPEIKAMASYVKNGIIIIE